MLICGGAYLAACLIKNKSTKPNELFQTPTTKVEEAAAASIREKRAHMVCSCGVLILYFCSRIIIIFIL